jgi:hypothetical protein
MLAVMETCLCGGCATGGQLSLPQQKPPLWMLLSNDDDDYVKIFLSTMLSATEVNLIKLNVFDYKIMEQCTTLNPFTC